MENVLSLAAHKKKLKLCNKEFVLQQLIYLFQSLEPYEDMHEVRVIYDQLDEVACYLDREVTNE
jgi:hypothetical protein